MAICVAIRLMPSCALALERSDVERNVPSISTDSGITLLVVPASIFVVVNTTGLKALILLTTMCCSAWTISQATGIGSKASCGIEAWPPLPVTFIFQVSAAARIGPGLPVNFPLSISGVMCSAKIASGEYGASNIPSSSTTLAP